MQRLILNLAVGFTVSFSQQVFATDWNSVTDKESRAAFCLNLRAPSEYEMQDLLESQINDPDVRINRVVRGIQFKNEIPEMVDLFEAIHSPPRYTTVNLNDLPATKCTSVMCAMKQYYGLKNALPILYIYAKFGISTAPEASGLRENYQNWKYEELLDVLVALESLPPTVLPIKDHHLLHFLKGYSLASYGANGSLVVANARVDVFDIWDGETRLSKISTLVHEFGHVLGYQLDDTAEWKSMPKEIISQYAMTNAAEDFAESFLAYRFAPQKLQRVSSKRYEYIKAKVFKGLEFKSQKDCDAPFLEFAEKLESKSRTQRELISWTESHKKEISDEIRRQEKMGSFVTQVIDRCGAQYLSETKDPSSRELTDKCIASVIKKRAAVVQLRSAGQNDIPDIKIPVGVLSDIEISRNKMSLTRQEMRYEYAKRLNHWYGLRDFTPGPKDNALCSVLIPNEDQAISAQEMMILIKACERKTKESFFKQLFEPDFYQTLH